MKVGVLGTGSVGTAIASRLVELGHDVTMGSRTVDNEAATGWASGQGDRAHNATFADAASFGEVLFNCTSGLHALEALQLAGADAIGDKVLVDVSNPLDFSNGFPPTLSVCNDDSLGEQVQAAFPDARVVKSLNTMNASLMVRPDALPGEHVVFLSGEDDAAKGQVASLLGEFGWPASSIVDLGGIESARATEMFLPLWTRLYKARGNANFNIGIVEAR